MGLFRRLAIALSLLCMTMVWLSGQAQKTDSLRYPIQDRRGDRYSAGSSNPFDLRDTAFVNQDIRYDPKTKEYYIYEKVGSSYFRKPISLTFEEFWRLRGRQIEAQNFANRRNTNFNLNRKLVKPKLRVGDNLFNRIFGNGKIDIKPQGNVDILAGYQGQNTKNPTLPENARKYGALDFDMNANFNVAANIGDKLRLPINYNTLANFDFENQLKLDYSGKSDEILKKLEAGNISFGTKSQLIPGAQALFGIKTQLQFGKLFVTAALANQKSQRQTQGFQGGAATQTFEKKLDDYEENRHFLLAQYFRNNYNRAMSTLPVIQSQVNILRMEVWITNRTGVTTDARDVVGLMDLGENSPYNASIVSNPAYRTPDNNANSLYSSIRGDAFRNPSTASNALVTSRLRQVEDFEKTYARKLNATEYTWNPQVGFLSLNTTLQTDEVLGVAFQYTYNGRTYQVGEFAQDVPLDSTRGIQKVLFLKLLKATSQRPNLPIWKLMMKNVYALDGASNIQRDGFRLNLLYQEPSGGEKRALPEGPANGLAILKILRLDRLNNNNDPLPDGVFDYVEGYTIQSQYGRIIFPVLEPLGRDLDTLAFLTPQQGLPAATPDIRNKYVYYALYDTIKAIAQQNFAQLNRFIFRGSAKSSNSSEIYLNAFNIPQGSVTVTANGVALIEGVDYSIDYNLGRVQIINQAIINSGIPVSVNFENNAGFGIQNRGFLGLRADYIASKKLQFGASMQRLTERPFFTKVNFGEDPIKNTMYGVDFNYRTESKGLTRLLNKLPFFNSSTVSSINAYGEAALLKPGHPPQIGKGEEGLIYVDDFEGTRSNIDLRFPFVGWTLASTPAGVGIPGADANNDFRYGYDRAKLSWYQIEPVLQDPQNTSNPNRDRVALSDPRVRATDNSELFPQRTVIPGQNQLITFDMTFRPKQRGQYNYDTRRTELNRNGEFLNPTAKWGGIMRSIDQTDFESNNIEFIEFWLQDPYITNSNFPNGFTNRAGGQLIFNLGNISEDILKDGRRFYENGLNTPTQPTLAVDSSTVWGKSPLNPSQITQAFSTDAADRPYQDVGFDGLDDAGERTKSTIKKFLDTVGINFPGSPFLQQANADPSNDNFENYRSDALDGQRASILTRYKNYNNPQGNSPINTGGSSIAAATLYPDNEDLNRDNTLNENEEYFEYKVDLTPNGLASVGQNYITDRRSVTVTYANGVKATENWYQFRIPIRSFTNKVGNIPDFKSIRFLRMYMKGWQDSVTLRMARLDLVRNQWRSFAYELTTDGTYPLIPANSTTTANTLAVNVEENNTRIPVPYKIPPGIERVQSLANNGVNILQNEQALSLRVRDLQRNQGRGVFKTLNLDIRRYKKLSMFIHAESVPGSQPIPNDSLVAVVRIGQDFLSNYYEVRIPLKITPPGTASPDTIWPSLNDLDFALQDLIRLKNERNSQNLPPTTYFSRKYDRKTYGILGNPNLGEVRGILFEVFNPPCRDCGPIDAEVWINELRLSQLDEQAAWAATGRVDVQLADLGSATFSMSHHSVGWGTIEQRVNERSFNAVTQMDFSSNLELGKLLPKEAGLSIPMYASISSNTQAPQYDAYDLDVKLKDKLNNSPANQRDSIRRQSLTKETTKTVNFTNVKKRPKAGRKPLPWDISNVDVTYSYVSQDRQSPTVEEDKVVRHRGVFGYNYATQAKYYQPFKNVIKSKTHWFDLIKDFNFNLAPSVVSVSMDVNRQFGRFIPRDVSTYGKLKVDTTYDKYFNFDRAYIYRWDLTRSLNFDYKATNKARVDEPAGALNLPYQKDTVRRNFFDGGRTTSFDQQVIFTYTLPLAKLPFTDWITARASYTAIYRWIASSLLAQQLNQGSFLENHADKNLNGEFDFTRLYSKSRFLRALDETPVPRQPKTNANPQNPQTKTNKTTQALPDSVLAKMTPKERRKAKREARRLVRVERRQERQNRPVELSGAVRTVGRVLTMVKRASVNYGESYFSRIPGYLDSTQFVGNDFKTNAPGLGYILGKQPDTAYLSKIGSRNLLTRNPEFNLLFTQGYEQKLNIQAQLEPIKEFTVDLNLDKTFTKNYSELYKDTTGTAGLKHLSPYATGGFSVSFIAFNTLFEKYNPNELSETFKRFENSRNVISKRLYNLNPYTNKITPSVDQQGYYTGYGKYSQDVLIPAFIAAYTKQDPNTVGLIGNGNPKINDNPFKAIKPKPNWRVNFTGLTKVPALQKLFSAISITHSYQSRLSMNSFTSALTFQDPLYYSFPSFIDTTGGANNYVPYFLVPNISIQEAFEPLIGIDITTNNQVSARFEYKKSRQLSLSLIDYQLSEIRSTEIVFTGSWQKRGFPVPFKLPSILNKNKGKKLENDIRFSLALGIRDDVTSNNRLDQGSTIPTAGQKLITIKPTIDYVLNNRVNLQLYYDQRHVIPYISSSAETIVTRAGLAVKISLAQ